MEAANSVAMIPLLGRSLRRRVTPFIRWPGGKRWLAELLFTRVRCFSYNRYIEPFLGGAAIFFALAPHKALLGDINGDLVNTYLQVQRRPKRLIELLRGWPVTAEKYLEVRRWKPKKADLRAARFLYLNRTCFAGMYRVNRLGHFNVPYGGGERTPTCLWSKGLLVEASVALQSAQIVVSDFEATLAQAGINDLVYCDPAYTVAHNNNGFIRYNERVFTWEDQKRLATACARAKTRGARVFVSNAHYDKILQLYCGATVRMVVRRSLLTPKAEKRRLVEEVLIEV